VPAGWRNNPSQPERVKFHGAHGEIDVAYRCARAGVDLSIDGQPRQRVHVDHCTPELVCFEVDRVLRSYDVHRVDGTFFVDSPLGASELVEQPRFPQAEEEVQAGSLVAPLPGVVDDVRVAAGDQVAAGDVLLVLESMKMLYPVVAPAAGRVAEVRVQKSAHVEARTVLVVIEESQ
jgi:propionyl-CoA carboxylase alpha chain